MHKLRRGTFTRAYAGPIGERLIPAAAMVHVCVLGCTKRRTFMSCELLVKHVQE